MMRFPLHAIHAKEPNNNGGLYTPGVHDSLRISFIMVLFLELLGKSSLYNTVIIFYICKKKQLTSQQSKDKNDI